MNIGEGGREREGERVRECAGREGGTDVWMERVGRGRGRVWGQSVVWERRCEWGVERGSWEEDRVLIEKRRNLNDQTEQIGIDK